MKKIAYFLLSVFLVSCGEKAEYGDFEDVPAGAEIEKFEDNPDLSRVTVNRAGRVVEQGDYYRGYRHGAWTEFNPSTGSVSTVTSYVNGVKEGIFVKLDTKGAIVEKLSFHNDQPHGQYLKLNRGKILEIREYSYGVLHGMMQKYYDNGTLMEESTFINGQREGMARWYDQDGTLTIEYEYRNGELIQEETATEESEEE